MNRELTLLVGVGVGAALMYMFDPERGRTRRKLLGDKLVACTNDLTDVAGSKARDLRNRARGVLAEAGSALGASGERGEQSGELGGARQQGASA